MDHGAWSSNSASGTGDIPFLGGYGAPSQHQAQHLHQQDPYGIDGMFGPSGSFSNFGGQPAFGGGYGVGAEYSTWDRKAAQYDDYYQTGRTTDHHTAYPSSAPSTGRPEESSSSSGVKQVEQVMQGLSLETTKPVQQELQQQQSQQPKKMTWASIASQPAKPQLTTKKKSMVPPPMVTPRTPSLDIGTWENKNGGGVNPPSTSSAPIQQPTPSTVQPTPVSAVQQPVSVPSKPVGQQQHLPSQQQQQHHHAQQQQQQYQQHVQQQSQHNNQQQQSQQQQQANQQQHQQANHQIQPQPRPTRPTPPPAALSQPVGHQQPVTVTPPKTAAAQLAVAPAAVPTPPVQANPVLEELQLKHIYNPKEFDLSAKNARFFVIKSYSEDDIHRSIKYEIWCSTEHGNKRLDAAFRERSFFKKVLVFGRHLYSKLIYREGKGPVYLYFSVNGSGHFCGMAEMVNFVLN